MIPARRLRVEWSSAQGVLVAMQPTAREIAERAKELAAAYNEPHNSAMLANTIHFTEADVVTNYAEMAAAGARAFFLYDGESFVGDADLRNIEDGRAELAILIAARGSQGKGMGTRFATLLHVVAFRELFVERVYVTLLPENVASRRVFEKIGHAVDTSPEARALTDDVHDVSMSIGKTEFARTHAAVMPQVRIGESVDG